MSKNKSGVQAFINILFMLIDFTSSKNIHNCSLFGDPVKTYAWHFSPFVEIEDMDNGDVKGAMTKVTHDMLHRCCIRNMLDMKSNEIFQNAQQIEEVVDTIGDAIFVFPLTRSLLMTDLFDILQDYTFLPLIQTSGEFISLLIFNGNNFIFIWLRI